MRMPFRPNLIQKIITNQKTETRRICRRINKITSEDYEFCTKKGQAIQFDRRDKTFIQLNLMDFCPQKIGQKLDLSEQHWRRPKTTDFEYHENLTPEQAKADGFRLMAAMYMRKEWCRYSTIVTHRDLMQLFYITDEAAIREGIPATAKHPRKKFFALWRTIHTVYPDRVVDDPWTWTIRFTPPEIN